MAFFAISRTEPLRLLSATELAAEHERLQVETAQLRQAVTSHAVIDQAIGAVVAYGRIPPEEAWQVLRDLSQHTNTKLRTVAAQMLRYAQGEAVPDFDPALLRRAITRHGARRDAVRAVRLSITSAASSSVYPKAAYSSSCSAVSGAGG
ncbi:ANTAR domain-containing protein, partial [Streptomyces sp. NPDC051987]|uniref:ANTAR domain-containing protein n=1 Tax=Streptomyces sp. NPDC051987 TaxID=3155808 RepID=UPI003415DE77